MTSTAVIDSMTADRAIRDLVARYSDAVNRRDATAWHDTWAADGVWHLMGQTQSGRDAVVAFWRQVMPQIPWVLQFPSAGLVDLSDDLSSATGRWYINEISQRPAGAGLTIGVYHDAYVVEDGGWRFAERRFDVLYSGPPDLSGQAFPFPTDLFVADV